MRNRFSQFHAAQIRIARPTGRLDQIIRFYEEGLGLKRLGEFHQHNGYDGVMFGLPTPITTWNSPSMKGKV